MIPALIVAITSVLIVAAAWVITVLALRPVGMTCEIQAMPGHPEQVRGTGDPVADAEYADIAEELLDDGLGGVWDELRWRQ